MWASSVRWQLACVGSIATVLAGSSLRALAASRQCWQRCDSFDRQQLACVCIIATVLAALRQCLAGSMRAFWQGRQHLACVLERSFIERASLGILGDRHVTS